jgi:FtsZ-interacting cell division protein ZipA
MSTLAIVLIAVGVIALLAILYFAFSPKRREQKRLAAARNEAASRHRDIAAQRESHASVAETRAEEARLKAERAQQEAELARREASMHEQRAGLHEEGELDHELRTDSETGTDHTTTRTGENGRFTDTPERPTDTTSESSAPTTRR